MSKYSEIRRQITQRADFGQFLEGELGIDIDWSLTFESGMCICPLHGDTDPSFSISKVDGVWLFHCFGCQKSGTIIEFFMEHYQIPDVKVAMEVICEKFEIEESLESISESFAATESGGRFDIKRRTLSSHTTAANRCRIALRSNPENIKWVAEMYKEMNKSLLENDFTRLEEMNEEALCAMNANSTPS